MGSIIRTAANNVGASGVFSSSAFNNASLNSITSLPTAVDGKMKLISSQTASSDASISFTSGIDSTYKTYCFKLINLHPSSDANNLEMNFSSDGGSNYNVTKTTTAFRAFHYENDSATTFEYHAASDIAQGTGYKRLSSGTGNANDEGVSGEIWLFNPSSTTYVKHFMGITQAVHYSDITWNRYFAGYCNTTSVINAINFRFVSDNIDDGTIALYGIA